MMNFLKKIFSSLNNKSDMKKYLILGIGNIGNEYDDTRHNIGFEIVDQLSQNLDTKFESVKLAQRAEGSFKGKKIIIIKPNNYVCLLYTSPSPRDLSTSRMPSSA